MTRFGYFLATEEHGPQELVRQARAAEGPGFDALWISDHFHPWLGSQRQSSFVWSVIGAIGQVTSLPVATAVTCPTTRIHPAIVAQAAATSAAMTPGGFSLGAGTGEALNEHILGDPWPHAARRLAMLEEAIDRFRREGGVGKPVQGGLKVCWAPNEQDAVRTAYERRPNEALSGEAPQVLPSPRHFEQLTQGLVTPEMVAEEWGRHA